MVKVSINYPRHFILLFTMAVTLGLADHWRWVVGSVPSVAVYGALHSVMLVAALRSPQTTGRKFLFVTLAAGFAVLSFLTGVGAGRLLGVTLGVASPALMLTLTSALGAASYGHLVRRFWIGHLSLHSLAWITLSCVLAVLAALASGSYLHAAGGWWFAMVWWWAFSIALWYQDRGVSRAGVLHVGNT